MTITVAVDDVMKSWSVGNGGHQVDPRLGVGQNPRSWRTGAELKGTGEETET